MWEEVEKTYNLFETIEFRSGYETLQRFILDKVLEEYFLKYYDIKPEDVDRIIEEDKDELNDNDIKVLNALRGPNERKAFINSNNPIFIIDCITHCFPKDGELQDALFMLNRRFIFKYFDKYSAEGIKLLDYEDIKDFLNENYRYLGTPEKQFTHVFELK